MAGHYPNRIKELPLYDGRFNAYKLEAKESNVLLPLTRLVHQFHRTHTKLITVMLSHEVN